VAIMAVWVQVPLRVREAADNY